MKAERLAKRQGRQGIRQSDALPADFDALDVSAFGFYGFEDSLSEIGRRLRRVGIRRDTPKVTVVAPALFVPTEQATEADQSKSWGGVLTADGDAIPMAQLHRKGKSVGRPAIPADHRAPRHEQQELHEEILYLGPLFNHFGRVLLESLARIWYLPEVDRATKVIFDYPNAAPSALGAWVQQVLTIFGLEPARILVLDQTTRLDRVIVPEPLSEQLHVAHQGMIRPFREVAARLAGDVLPSEQPVYLSRRLLSSRQRPIIGERELEEVLRDNGFLIVYPETLPFAEQVRLVNRHRHIFSGVGSAAHSILFAQHQPTLHLLTNGDQIPANYFLCSAVAVVPTTFVNCLDTGGRGSFADERHGGGDDAAPGGAPGGQATPQLIDLAKMADYLDRQGFLSKQSRAIVAGRTTALQHDYDEAWLYARARRSNPMRGKPLPAAVEQEAVRLAAQSWPLSWILTRYYSLDRQTIVKAEAMALQFADLVQMETDATRLAYFRADVAAMHPRVAHALLPATRARLLAVVAAHLESSEETAAVD